MAGGSFSSTTSTSHTLSGDTPHAPLLGLHPASKSALIAALSASPQSFLQPPPDLHTAALALAKSYLDPLATRVTEAQLQRQKEARRKRKRGEGDGAVAGRILQLNKLYLDGFNIDQVWEQARRVLNAATDELERALPDVLKDGGYGLPISASREGAGGDRTLEVMQFDTDGFEIGSSDGSADGGEAEWETGDNALPQEVHKQGDFIDEGGNPDRIGDLNLHMPGGSESDGDDLGEMGQAGDVLIEDPYGLNDGFFSIDQFNKQTEFLERQDVIGDPGAASDDEEIDWDADPALISKSVSALKGMEDEGEEDGPTFGDMGLINEDSNDEMDIGPVLEPGMEDNTNDIKYMDFFAPPARKADKGERKSKLKKYERNEGRGEADDERDIQRTIEAVRRDLFEDQLSNGESDDDSELEQLDPGDPKSRRSSHERRQILLAEEIRMLEAESVAKRQWTLSGEARANDRPLNSLLEEDLEFERTGKPVPVITAEVSESIEEIIKRRIVNQEFDEVIRRRPGALGKSLGLRRGRFELDDGKPQQSLAEMYEEEHLRKADPDNYRDKNDEKLRKKHEEIETLWADISGKLDSLSSWHYKPKPAQPSVNIVADVPTITMEEAQPTAAGGSAGDLGGSSMLAPQEVYTPGKATIGAGEVATKSKAPVAKSEMSREQKLRRRRREKERLKKQIASQAGNGKEMVSKKVKARKDVVGDLKRGGVKVIGKGGEVRDVDGKAVKGPGVLKGAGGLKL
ncbi:MAG: U3 snoRNP protein [Geoglossum umbratile]|nr:MAG: U3 snoRNP protein [Geoglossum umbratile]